MKYTFVTVDIADGIAKIEVNRPPVNALNYELLHELHNAVGRVGNDDSVRVAVLTGAGKNFAAGADIKEIRTRAEDGPDEVEEFSMMGQRAFRAMEVASIPYIACVSGFCLGGGNELAMGAHIRIADSTAKFGQPEIKLGIIPGFGATYRLPQLIGKAHALNLLLTGEPIDANRALELGLVDLIAPEGKTAKEFGLEVAAKIAAQSAPVIRAMMQSVGSEPIGPDEAIKRETKTFGKVSELHDMKEGFDAFIGKRAAKFEHR